MVFCVLSAFITCIRLLIRFKVSLYKFNHKYIIVPQQCSDHARSALTHCSDATRALWRLRSPTIQLFVQPCVHTYIKENIKAMRYWPFVRGIHRWAVDSPHKGPVTWTMFPCHDVFMGFNTYTNKTQEIENRADFLVCSVRTYVSGPTFPQLPRRLVRTTEAPSDINSVQRPHVSREVLDTSCLCLISFITIDSSHKSHSAWDKCHTIRHFVTEMRTHMPILLPNGVL